MADLHWAERPVTLNRTARHAMLLGANGSVLLPISADRLDQLLDAATPENTFKHDRTTTVAKVIVGDQALILKRYNARSQWHKVKRALRKSRARISWHMSFAFQHAGLNVSQPLMMFEQRIGLLRQNAYFANRPLSGHELLSALPMMDKAKQRQVQTKVLEAFKRLARARISHGDMKATNLLWVDDELFFIDLDAAQQHAIWSPIWYLRHHKDKRRFMKNWRDHPQLLELFTALN